MSRDRSTPTGPDAIVQQPLLGMLLMIVAMMIIPLVDGIAKHLSADYSPLLISWVRYFAATCLVLPITLAARRGRILPRTGLPSQVLRTVFLVAAMTSFFYAISLVPLASALGAYFVSPLFATLLAAVILKERLTLTRVCAVAVGFIGALVILKPGTAEIEPGLLLALASGFLFACYMVASRMAAQSSPPLVTVTFQYLLGTLLLLPFAIATWQAPTTDALWWVALMGVLSVATHMFSINAFRLAPASTLSPLIYFELVSATIIGVLFFGEFPDSVTWAGIAIVVISGLGLLRSNRPSG